MTCFLLRYELNFDILVGRNSVVKGLLKNANWTNTNIIYGYCDMTSEIRIVKLKETSVARQRLRKHIPTETNAVNTPSEQQRGSVLCVVGTQVVIKKSSVEKNWMEFRDASLPGYELGSRGIELSWQLQNNGREVITQWKEGFLCGLKWQWDWYNSVARIQLLKTENPSACVTVNCKVCRSAIAL
jgi:hypothetical protein